jgi:hypothetical protein
MASTEKSNYVLFDTVVPPIAFQMSYADKSTDAMKVDCQKSPECFSVSFMERCGFEVPHVYTHYFCKHHILTKHEYGESHNRYTIRPHTLSLEVLMTIKHFQVSHDPYFHKGLDVYNKHPEYFQGPCIQDKLDDKEMKTTIETTLEKIARDKKSIEKGRNRLVELRDAIEVERQDLTIDKIEFEKKKQQHELELLKMREDQTTLEKDRDYYRDIVESFRKDLYALFPSDSIL